MSRIPATKHSFLPVMKEQRSFLNPVCFMYFSKRPLSSLTPLPQGLLLNLSCLLPSRPCNQSDCHTQIRLCRTPSETPSTTASFSQTLNCGLQDGTQSGPRSPREPHLLPLSHSRSTLKTRSHRLVALGSKPARRADHS